MHLDFWKSVVEKILFWNAYTQSFTVSVLPWIYFFLFIYTVEISSGLDFYVFLSISHVPLVIQIILLLTVCMLLIGLLSRLAYLEKCKWLGNCSVDLEPIYNKANQTGKYFCIPFMNKSEYLLYSKVKLISEVTSLWSSPALVVKSCNQQGNCRL